MDQDVQEKFDKVDQRFDELMIFLRDNVATKDDLRNFATKDDLRNFATKDDLRNFATKDDLKQFATKDDLLCLENKMDAGFSNMHSELYAINKQLDRLEERMKKLEKRTDEDYGALVQDFLALKKRVRILELNAQQ